MSMLKMNDLGKANSESYKGELGATSSLDPWFLQKDQIAPRETRFFILVHTRGDEVVEHYK